jgi:hypothetical protein
MPWRAAGRYMEIGVVASRHQWARARAIAKTGREGLQGVCPRLSVEEDVPLRTFSKLAFYWSASATTKLILESLRKLTARSWAGSGRCRGNEARSDHDFAVSLAIPCVRNMLRERWYSMRRPWVITECPPLRERRRWCCYAAPFRRFARLLSIFGYMAIFGHRLSCVGRS